MTEKEANKNNPLILEKPKTSLFELRLIIWSVEGIVCENKLKLDLFVQAKMDQDGW